MFDAHLELKRNWAPKVRHLRRYGRWPGSCFVPLLAFEIIGGPRFNETLPDVCRLQCDRENAPGSAAEVSHSHGASAASNTEIENG